MTHGGLFKLYHYSYASFVSLRQGVLMRRWMPPTMSVDDADWATVHQVVAPNRYRQKIIKVAHDNSFSGDLGVRKILNRIWRNFYWRTAGCVSLL